MNSLLGQGCASEGIIPPILPESTRMGIRDILGKGGHRLPSLLCIRSAMRGVHDERTVALIDLLDRCIQI